MELRHVTEFPSGFLLSNFQPGDKFVQNAKQQIQNMEWEYTEKENGTVSEQTVICYLLKSNPDEPLCSNDLDR
jgi:hypothetical protein